MSASVAENTATIANLLDAFGGESNATARYTAYAAKADRDGWLGVGSLFRATARAEQIHAANHARAIRQLGSMAHCEVHQVEIRSTLENLRVALGGEQFEIDTMYPAFIEVAKTTGNSVALRTFTWACEAEKTHARLYREAMALVEAGLKESWVGKERNFYVCPVCGYTSASREEHELCPVCNLARDRFEIVGEPESFIAG